MICSIRIRYRPCKISFAVLKFERWGPYPILESSQLFNLSLILFQTTAVYSFRDSDCEKIDSAFLRSAFSDSLDLFAALRINLDLFSSSDVSTSKFSSPHQAPSGFSSSFFQKPVLRTYLVWEMMALPVEVGSSLITLFLALISCLIHQGSRDTTSTSIRQTLSLLLSPLPFSSYTSHDLPASPSLSLP